MGCILKVGLTGGIACGRSTLSRHLHRPGWLLIDADDLVHGLLGAGGEAVAPVLEAFGPAAGDAGGGVDRRAVGRIIFRDKAARRRLEAIIHPMVIRSIDGRIAAFSGEVREGIAVVDAALMVETGSYRRYDRLVVAHCDPEIQLRRLMARDSLDEAQARARVAAQAPLAEKVALADYTIDTGGTLEETRIRTLEVAERLEDELRALADGRGREGGRGE